MNLRAPPALRLSIVGSVGIPNRYGGFESFAEQISVPLQATGLSVSVTCERARYLDDLREDFHGVRRVFIGLPANGAWSPLHDLLACVRMILQTDCVLVLGVSAGLFFPLLRLIAGLAGCRLLVNVDGVEWRRSKFNRAKRAFLYLSDWMAQRFAHAVIFDNAALAGFVHFPDKSHCIAYSGDHAVRGQPMAATSQPPIDALTICRIEPENNCEMLIQGFLASRLGSYCFVGNWTASAYGRELRQRYAAHPRLQLLDPIYAPERLLALRRSCTHYLHGHAVGGTNPSLVEMLFFDCRILCFDCAFNRCTAEESATYFSDAAQLAGLLNLPTMPGDMPAPHVRQRYTLQAIVSQLLKVVRARH